MSDKTKQKKIEWLTPTVNFYDKMSMLYKYRAFNDQSLSILINSEIFCATPSSLNDPFDSQIDVRASLSAALDSPRGTEILPFLPRGIRNTIGW